MQSFWRRFFGEQTELALVILIGGILMVLFAPIPPGLLDFLLITNFSLIPTEATYVSPGSSRSGEESVASCQPDAVSSENVACASSVPPSAQIRPTWAPVSCESL